jgi:hypothetical protein
MAEMVQGALQASPVIAVELTDAPYHVANVGVTYLDIAEHDS